jgi:hypothetical protein
VASESGQLKFEITDLYMTAPAFTRAGDGIAAAESQASSQLHGLGEFWGNDSPGQKFASFYVKAQDELLSLIGTVAGEVRGVADGINKMAAQYGIAEEANVNKIRALQQEMP